MVAQSEGSSNKPVPFRAAFGELSGETLKTPTEGRPDGLSSPPIGAPLALDENSDDKDRERAFVDALRKLSQYENQATLDDERINDYVSFFVTLYGRGPEFRHMYSSICSVMYSYLKTDGDLDQGDLPAELEALATNISLIDQTANDKERKYVEDELKCKNYDRAMASLKKLRDHIGLERTRLQYLVVQNKQLAEASREAQTAAENARTATDAVKNSLDEAKQEYRHSLDEAKQEYRHSLDEAKQEYREIADRSKRDYVTILGIFAAIILTFTSGFAFSASVLQNIAAVSIGKLLLVALVIGCFLFNLITTLLVFIGKVSRLFANMTVGKIFWRIFLPTNVAFVGMLVCVLHFFPNCFG